MTTCPVCHAPVPQPKKGRKRKYCEDRCKWTARRRRRGQLSKEERNLMRRGQKSEPSTKEDWGRDNRRRFIDKLLNCDWTHYRDRKRFESETYQKNGYRIECDCAGLFLWGPWEEDNRIWLRLYGLSSDDIDRIRDDCLLFVEPGVMRWRRFDLQRGEWK